MGAHENLTFDAVAAASHEVTYDEVAHHYPGPMSKHQWSASRAILKRFGFVRTWASEWWRTQFAFALGSPAYEIPWREVKRSLKHGHLPMVISSWCKGSLMFAQTSFTALINSPDPRSSGMMEERLTCFLQERPV
jgi:hypothetical protein